METFPEYSKKFRAIFSACSTTSCVLGFHSADGFEMNPTAAIRPETVSV
jgi:hypothetical protein